MRNNQGRARWDKALSAKADTCLNTNRETLIIRKIAKTELNNCFEKHIETNTVALSIDYYIPKRK